MGFATTSTWRVAMPIGIAAAIACALPASAQSLPGLDPVKVKTIPMGAKEAAPVPPYPRTPTAGAPLKEPSPGSDLPTTKVKTLRIDGKGRVVGKTDSSRP